MAVAFEDSFWWHISTFDDVWVTDASQNGVRHLVRDLEKEKSMRAETISLMRELSSKWDDLAKQWRAAVPSLTSEDNWEKFFQGE